MNVVDHLISTIYDADKQIAEYNTAFKKKEVDIMQPNWQEKMMEENALFHSTFEKTIRRVENELIEKFKELTLTEREQIWKALSEATAIQQEMTSDFLNDNSLENLFLLEIIGNLRPDPRDALIYMNDLIEDCEYENKNYKEVIRALLPFADTTDWSGMGSMRSYLEKFLE